MNNGITILFKGLLGFLWQFILMLISSIASETVFEKKFMRRVDGVVVVQHQVYIFYKYMNNCTEHKVRDSCVCSVDMKCAVCVREETCEQTARLVRICTHTHTHIQNLTGTSYACFTFWCNQVNDINPVFESINQMATWTRAEFKAVQL